MTERLPVAKRGARPARKGAPTAKLVISAASLAATLGGWALIADGETAAAVNPVLTPAATRAPQPAEVAPVARAVPPLPTIVDLVVPATMARVAPSIEAPAAPIAAAAPPPIAPEQPVARARPPALRVVTVPPPSPRRRVAVAITRSSR